MPRFSYLWANDLISVRRSTIGLIVRVFAALAALTFSILAGRILGAAGTGAFFIALAVATVGVVFSKLGLDTAIVKIVGRENTSDRKAEVGGLFFLVSSLVFAIGLLLFSVLWLSAERVSSQLFNLPALSPVLKVMALLVPILSLVHIQAAFLRGRDRVSKSFCIQYLLIPLLSIAVVLLTGVDAPVDFAIVYVAASAFTLITGGVLWFLSENCRDWSFETALKQELAKLVPPMLQSAIMNAVIIRWSAIIFLGIWSTDIEAGYFSAASRVAIALSLALVTTNAVAAPRLAKQFANGEIAAVAITSSTATAFALLIASPIFFLCFFLPSWTMSLFGQEFVSAGNVLLVLVAGELMNVLVGPVGTLLQMSGYERVYRNCTIASAMLQVALCIFLIPKFGAMGAAIATASALFLTNLLAFLFTYKLLAVLPLPFVAARVRVRR